MCEDKFSALRSTKTCRGMADIAALVLNLGITPRPLYPQVRTPGTYRVGGLGGLTSEPAQMF